MSGRIPRSFIDDLLVRVDIVDLIDSFVPLKKTGSNYVARCPFHTEKTPSFSVSRSKQFFYCFGCGANGNAIGFLMDYSHLDFVEAVEDLAAFAGVDVPREAVDFQARDQKGDLTAIYELLGQAEEFYRQQLRGHPEGKKAIAYLRGRGLSGEVARDFALGYAPDDWRPLLQRFDRRLLVEAGLLSSQDDGRVYGRFRNRLIFPIRDRRGRVLGFGGRALGDAQPKYLNSPETPVFHKGKEVYGLYELLKNKIKPQRILLVEGYLDVIALAQYGIHYAAATLGTASSQAHMDLLFRFAPELVFCFDGDAAGRQAAWKAVNVVLPSLRDGRQVRIMLLPQGHDPDTMIREKGSDYFVDQVAGAASLSDYFFQQLTEGLNLQELEGRVRLVEKSRPLLEKLPDGVFREMMFARLQEMSKVASLAVLPNAATLRGQHKGMPRTAKNKLSPARTAIALLLQYPELADIAEQKRIDWSGLDDYPGISLLLQILRRIASNPQLTMAGVVEGFRGLPEEKQVKALASLELLIPEQGVASEFSDALDRLVVLAGKHRLEALLAKERAEGLDRQERELLLTMLVEQR